ncbi:membrane protein insertase YidC [Actinotalea fermentans]|uniref:Membrane protein insertase YidC n=1 Tax=Actinotalea fermentans TaxID=43671 RepID=A0A511Z248_9CELL|nr:membrane protein insertase YidC [Actinotalea fermentans]KGM16834.1 hypothetical protein N867_15040 [Actinotalea fermentans ATCC 43279 = JCM 9966 = DSM 3133]GEN81525.1 hypothetical protein AFE02nite_32590 [Actinotalea fermentans]
MSWYDTLLQPIMIVVAWIMVGVHDLLANLGLGADSGVTWTLSIVALVIIMRALLIPLFVRQIRSARAMQMLSPELQALQKKYKGRNDPASREAMTRETMALYQKHGTNPFSSCLPILAQSPIFFALFRLLNNLPNIASGKYPTVGPMDRATASSVENAEVFNAPISSYFFSPTATTSVKIVTVVLIVAMSLTTFTTQKQLTQKNMPATALQGPMAQQQKMLLYVLPIIFAVSGVNFPIGVLIYWTTTNLWSMGQQFYVIRRNPTPGSEAERLLKERRARKAAKHGIVLEEEAAEPEKPRGQRQQPVRKDRARPTTAAGGTGAARPAGARPDGAKPAGAKPGAKPAGAKPSTGGSTSASAAGGKTPAARAGGGKPAGEKPAGRKPAGEKPAGAGGSASGTGRATGAKPAGGKAAGGKATAPKAPGSKGPRPTRPTSETPADTPDAPGAAAPDLDEK